MVQNIASPLDWQMNFAVNWSKVNCILKSRSLTFCEIQVPKIIIHQNMSKYETYSSRNQKVKISFWKVKISKLRNFSKCWKFLIFSQLWAKFSPWCNMIQKKLSTWKLYISMKYTTFLHRTSPKNSWISSYNFVNTCSWTKNNLVKFCPS